MTLQGKSAIVSGGNSGIGMAIVLALAEAGANVAIDYVATPTRPTRSRSRSPGSVRTSIGIEADVSKVEDLQRLVDETVKALGGSTSW